MYVNGEYYGVLSLREKVDKNYVMRLKGFESKKEFKMLEYFYKLESINGNKSEFEELNKKIKKFLILK